MPSSFSQSPASGRGTDFATTQWSLVLAAGHPSQPDAAAALARLCQAYWYPIYAYVRRRTADVHQAQDLTQEFFVRLLEREVVAVAQPERGRFRSFLLTALKHFLASQWEKAGAAKRGGGQAILSLDFEAGESRISLEPVDDRTPERLFERQWVITLLAHVMDRLEQECAAAGKGEQFEQLKGLLAGRSAELPVAQAAAALGLSEEATRQAAHRLRARYKELLRAEVAQTVARPEEVEDELRGLFAALGS
jgi:RNA polymerase sigma-70 factor (ECF subfamily)